MSAYVLSVVGTVLICCVFTAIIPEGKTGNLIQGVTKWICILTIVSPILLFFQTGKPSNFFGEDYENILQENGIQTDASFIEYYSELRIQDVERILAEEIKEKYHLEVDIELVWQYDVQQVEGRDVQGVRIVQICVSGMLEQPQEKKEDVRKHLMEKYCNEVLIE